VSAPRRSHSSVQNATSRIRRDSSSAGNAPKGSAPEIGLDLPHKVPADDRRAEQELDLRNAVSWALMARRGWASPEAEQSSARTTELRQRLTIDFEQTWYALRGDYLVHLTCLDLRKAVETAAQMIARAEERGSARH